MPRETPTNQRDPWGRMLAVEPTARGTYALNTLAGALSALTMVVLQLLTTRILGAEAAGRVSVDAATVLLCFHIGQLNMRPVQATDLSGRFTFPEYLTLKTGTTALMLVLCLAYTLVRGYDGPRTLFCLAFCAFKALETFSDGYWGLLHSRSRLDLAALGAALHLLTGMLAFGTTLLLTRRLELAAVAMALSAGAVLLLYTWPLGRRVERPRLCDHWRRIGQLLGVLVPLFAAGYLMNLAVTLPKYALERTVSEGVQGHFAALYMTAQGVLLLSAFVYFPQLTALAGCYTAGDRAGFLRLLRRLGAWILLLDLGVVAGGWLCGPELLGWFFHLELTPYRLDLVLILLGGGGFAFYTLMSYGLIAMKQQQGLWRLTLAALAVAAALDLLLVPRLGLRGAALGYLLTMLAAALLVLVKLRGALAAWPEGRDEHA